MIQGGNDGIPVYSGNVGADVEVLAVMTQHHTEL